MEKTRILLVDDEQNLAWAVRRSLSDEGYEVFIANDGVEGLTAAHRYRPDLIILDIVMPRLNGLEVCRKLRREPDLAAVPILFLTALSAVEDVVAGLNEGGDDYLIKLFNFPVLRARIRALLRRSQFSPSEDSRPEGKNTFLTVGTLTLDIHTCQVRVREKTVQLTPAEFQLLHYLMTHHGQIFSGQQLLQQVWGYPSESTEPSLVRWHIRNLRAKIEPDPNSPTYIHTVPHHGYILEEGWKVSKLEG